MHRFQAGVLSGLFTTLIAASFFTPTAADQQETTKEQDVTIDSALEKVVQIQNCLETNDVASAKQLLSDLKYVLDRLNEVGPKLIVPDSVDRNTASIKAIIPQKVLQTKQVWLGVTPSRMIDLVWIQQHRLVDEKSDRTIFLGGEETTDEKFTVVLLAFPVDAKIRAGKMQLTVRKKLGGKVLVSKTIHRVK